MADEMTPITRLEGILAGQDIQPITRLEYFLKQYAGGGSGGGAGAFVVNATMSGSTLTCDKTAAEMFDACQTRVVLISVEVSGAINVLTVIAAGKAGSAYTFGCSTGSSNIMFATTGGDSYPQATMG